MSAVIGALRAELSASIAKFQSDMGRAAAEVGKFAKRAEAEGKRIENVGKRMSIALTAPLVAFAVKAVQQGKESAQALGQVEAALASTGGRSGKTAADLQKTAKVLERLSTFDDDNILKEVSANLLTFGNVSGAVFDRAQRAIVNISARLGTDLQGNAIKVGKALNDPIAGMQALSRIGVTFTATQKDVVKHLVATGEGAKAQELILAELEKRFEGAAEAQRKNDPFAAMAQSFRELSEAAGPLIVEIIQPLIGLVKTVAEGFAALSPTMQRVVVYGGAIVAVLGPLVTLIGATITVVAGLMPYIVGLAAGIAGLSVPMWGFVAATIAGVAALVYFQKATLAWLRGDIIGTLAEIKNGVVDMWRDLESVFKKPLAPKIEFTKAGTAGFKTTALAPFKLDFGNTPEQTQAVKKFDASLTGMAEKIKAAFDKIEVPAAIASARALNAELDEYVRQAKEADAGTAGFATRIAELRAQIVELEQAGLAAEAEKFARAVDKSDLAVRRFAAGALDPLTEKLETIDTAYLGLRDQIEAQIADNAVLAESNDEAARAMERLRAQLVDLDAAHRAAADGARVQYAAEQKIAGLHADAENLRTTHAIEDLRQARGVGAPISSDMARLQDIQRTLAQAQIDSETKIAELQAQRAASRDEAEVARLTTAIDLQQQLGRLIAGTSAEQMRAAENMTEALRGLADGLSASVADMIADWKFDLSSLRGVFRQFIAELIRPGISGAGSAFGAGIGAVFKSFAGLFADGGFLQPGQWGIAGEAGPEPIFGGRSGMSVIPAGGDAAARGDIYIDARGADERAVMRLGKVVSELQLREQGRIMAYHADMRARTR